MRRLFLVICATTLLVVGQGCRHVPRPGERLKRSGDEIVAAGQLFHTGTRVVLWTDQGGYDAYRVERRFSPMEAADWDMTKSQVTALTTPNRYGLRRAVLTAEQAERVRGGGWDLALLQEAVDQFVIHYDACGTARQCFKVLHDLRGLSVHFLLDLDGTIYQTLDLKERAWHATTSNSRSVGIEIAHIGAYPPGKPGSLEEWYSPAVDGKPRISVPSRLEPTGFARPGFIGRPARPTEIVGTVQGRELRQYDFTPEQYEALVKLTATLCTVLPKIRCDYPRNERGKLVSQKLPDPELNAFQGVLGHFHIQTNKVDPGPAFQWDRVVEEARALIRGKPDRRMKRSFTAPPKHVP